MSFTQDKLAHELAAALPARLARYSAELAAAAVVTTPMGWRALRWAFLLAAVLDNESRGGDVLSPPGPGGTADNGHGRGLMQLDDRAPSASRSDLEHELWTTIRGPTVDTPAWQFAAANILAGARILSRLVAEAPSITHAVAAYNAGSDRAFPAEDPTTKTYRPNYVPRVLASAQAFDQAREA